jgi:hypothetical protein
MPNVDIVAKVTPYAQKLVGQRLGPERLTRDAFKLLQQAQSSMRDMPLQLNQLMMDLQTGSLSIGVVDREAESMRDEVRWAGIRVALALCAGAMSVSGAYLVAPYTKMLLQRIPVAPLLGVVLVCVSGAMFIGLVMHTLFAARIHPSDWIRRAFAVVRFFLPGK